MIRWTSMTSNLVLDIGGLALNWTTLPGQIYHVMFKNNLTDTNWMDLSGPLTATSTITSWTDIVSATVPQRFYQILNEQP